MIQSQRSDQHFCVFELIFFYCAIEILKTFYSDFSIAERFGENAIRYRFEGALDWRKNVIFLTELVMVLNWKIWEHYKTNEPFARLYSELYERAYEETEKNFDEEFL